MARKIIITLTEEEHDFMRWIASKQKITNQELMKNIFNEYFQKEKDKYWNEFINDTEFLASKPIGHKISLIRKKKGITQAELAEKLGVSVQMISEWERGYRNPKLENAKKLATALGVSIHDLI